MTPRVSPATAKVVGAPEALDPLEDLLGPAELDDLADLVDLVDLKDPGLGLGLDPAEVGDASALAAPSPVEPWSGTTVARRVDVLSGLMTKIAVTDTLVLAMAVVGAQLLRFGSGDPVLTGLADFRVSYSWLNPALVVAWLIALRLHSAYDSRLVGHGPEEFKIVAGASFWLFAAVAVVCYVGRLPVARGYVALAMPAGLVGLLVHRWLWRKWLTGQRTKGRMSGSVLVVGDRDHLSSLIASFQSVPGAGFRVVAACCSDAPEGSIGSIPVVGDEGDAAAAAARLGVNTVACTSSWRLGGSGLRRLGWALEGLNINLVVSPGLTDVAGPRVLTRPVAGLPVLHVEAPVFAGPRLALKTLLDRVGAAALLVLFGPLFVVIAVSVWAHDRGPILFSHDRIGRGGKTFRMHKFRSMVTNAEDLLPDLLATSGIGSVPLYKVRRDPRVTPVGSWLRRFSLDELPQLINVVRGEMSLVGPRPQVQFEVDTYASDVRRRLLVKPGMTGLWQINGRSNLSWDQAVRFALYYVENWSVMLDLMILWRTARAVVGSQGAY